MKKAIVTIDIPGVFVDGVRYEVAASEYSGGRMSTEDVQPHHLISMLIETGGVGIYSGTIEQRFEEDGDES